MIIGSDTYIKINVIWTTWSSDHAGWSFHAQDFLLISIPYGIFGRTPTLSDDRKKEINKEKLLSLPHAMFVSSQNFPGLWRCNF